MKRPTHCLSSWAYQCQWIRPKNLFLRLKSKKEKRMETKHTIVISGSDNIVAAISRYQSNIRKTWCACVDAWIPAFSMSEGVRQGYIAAKNRGVQIRYITEINSENLAQCKEIIKFAELRHLAGIKASFSVSESEFVAGLRGGKSLEKLVYSNVPEMVVHQQGVFETFWNNATPALDRIKELES